MKGQTVDNDHLDGIIDFVWDYVKSETTAELRHNCQRLLDSVFDTEKTYLQEHCISKEKQFVIVYQTTYSNLGCNST